MNPHDVRTDEDLAKFLAEEGYTHIRILPDGVIGCLDMMYTRALVTKVNAHSVEKRYCYPDRDLAVDALNAMESIEDEPLAGYTAIKGHSA